MGTDIVAGLTAVFIILAILITFVSSRLVIGNWRRIVAWRIQDRQTQVKLALWLGTPLLMGTLAIQHIVAMVNYLVVYGIPTISLVVILTYRPVMLFAMALLLWVALNMAYGDDPEFADRLWLAVVAFGSVIGAITAVLSFLF